MCGQWGVFTVCNMTDTSLTLCFPLFVDLTTFDVWAQHIGHLVKSEVEKSGKHHRRYECAEEGDTNSEGRYRFFLLDLEIVDALFDHLTIRRVVGGTACGSGPAASSRVRLRYGRRLDYVCGIDNRLLLLLPPAAWSVSRCVGSCEHARL